MEEDHTLNINPYNNELAQKELYKMMRREEKITASFVIDKYGYEALQVESKKIDKFTLQLRDGYIAWILCYFKWGDIFEPEETSNQEIKKSSFNSSNDYAKDMLKQFLEDDIDIDKMHIIPEIADKHGRLTVLFRYPNGVFVIKIRRDEEIINILASKDF